MPSSKAVTVQAAESSVVCRVPAIATNVRSSIRESRRLRMLELPIGKLRIITPTQSVMDRLAAAYARKDAQSRDQAIMVAPNQDIDWEVLKAWFADEGESEQEYRRFKGAVRERKRRKDTKRTSRQLIDN